MTPRTPARCLVAAPAKAFPVGYTAIAREGPSANRGTFDALMDFGVMRLRPNQKATVVAKKETVWVLMSGSCEISLDGVTAQARRQSVFDDGPTTIHCAPESTLELGAGEAGAEWTVAATSNARLKASRLYLPSDFTAEVRGAGLAQGACRRLVRTIFDYSTRPDSNFVIGEVVNLPGRWSSYPPHHHPQPEVYHYRFTEPQGYGHAEVGEEVYKVRSGDTTRIPGGLEHAQVSAPGYGMYYLWIVRHLPRRPYRGFKFTPAHSWLLDASRQGWQPPVSVMG